MYFAFNLSMHVKKNLKLDIINQIFQFNLLNFGIDLYGLALIIKIEKYTVEFCNARIC